MFADKIWNRRIWYLVPVLAYASFIFYLSSLSHPEEHLPKVLFENFLFEIFDRDKLLHVIEYALLALFCYPAFRWSSGPRISQQTVLLVIVITSFYGITDEVHQGFVPFREASWLDWAADTTGAIIGAVSSRLIAIAL